MTWRTLFLEFRSGLFFLRLVVWDPETGEFTCVEGRRGSRRGRRRSRPGASCAHKETSMPDDLRA